MYVAQAKAQVPNTYSGSLSLSNLFDGLLRRNVGRLTMVVLANVIGLLMVAGDILGLINRYLGVLGVTTTALAGVIIADYYLIRRRKVADPDEVESVNWAGVVSVLASAATGGFLTESGITPLGFLVTLGSVLVLYPVLRRYVFRANTASER
ncbi:cytosine permease [Fodinicola feengrottensis]